VRIAIVYDCLYPNTVGGAERWYRDLAKHLQARHEVTYLTRRQWDEGTDPEASFPVIAIAPGGPLYTGSGRRRIWPPIRFGVAVFWHLLRHGRRYDVVHSDAFPYFSLIGAWLALRLRRRRGLLVDWFEVWSRAYWRDYLGRAGGLIGDAVQRLCIKLPDGSFVFSRLHERRLLEQGHAAPLTRLTGLYAGGSRDAAAGPEQSDREPLVVFAGRHIAEKRVAVIPDVIAAARRELPDIRCVVYGDGPERDNVQERVAALGLERVVELPGKVPEQGVAAGIARASCLLLPSLREGFGLVVVEAVAAGTPAVLVEGPDNAAAELVAPGVNGFLAGSPSADAIADAVVTAIRAGESLRRSTREWYAAHAKELSIDSSLAAVESAYERLSARS
jgi:glycosyltransferase involved in cell wall biosynthesis